MKRGQEAGRQGPEARQGQDLEPLGWPLVRLALVLVLGAIAPLLDTTIASVALHTLAGQFRVGVSAVQWVTTGYLLALAVVIPVSGWATERFGDKPVWIGSLLLFTVGSVRSGQARDFGSLVASRALQGAAAGLITPVVQTMLVRAAGREKLGRVITIVTIVSLFPPIAGPVVAGLILAHASWRWIFYVNVPIGAAAIILAWVFVPRPAARPPGQARRRLGVAGFLLLSPALVAILYGLSQAATGDGFASASALAPLAAGAVLAAGYLSYSLRRPGLSLVDLRLFAVRSFGTAGGVLFFSGLSLYAAMFLLPLYYQEVRGRDALAAGLLLAPQGLGALLSRPSGRWSTRSAPAALCWPGSSCARSGPCRTSSQALAPARCSWAAPLLSAASASAVPTSRSWPARSATCRVPPCPTPAPSPGSCSRPAARSEPRCSRSSSPPARAPPSAPSTPRSAGPSG
jgi:EmrB/QacA subfamily drug resistance transporter